MLMFEFGGNDKIPGTTTINNSKRTPDSVTATVVVPSLAQVLTARQYGLTSVCIKAYWDGRRGNFAEDSDMLQTFPALAPYVKPGFLTPSEGYGKITVVIQNFAVLGQVPTEVLQVEGSAVDAAGTALSLTISSLTTIPATEEGELDDVQIVLKATGASSGEADFQLWLRSDNTVRATFKFMYKAMPTTAPELISQSAYESPFNVEKELTITLENFRIVEHLNKVFVAYSDYHNPAIRWTLVSVMEST